MASSAAMMRGLASEQGGRTKKTRVIDSHEIEAHWFSNNSRFWYVSEYEPKGSSWEYILVDAIQGTRQLAFDHERLALALRQALAFKVNVLAHCLPLDSLQWDDEEGVTFSFTVANNRWRCDPGRSYHLQHLTLDDRPDGLASHDPQERSRRLPLLTQPHATQFTGVESAIVFINQTLERIFIFWIDTAGRNRSYGFLEPSQSRRQHTYAGHMWLLQDVNGLPLAVFEAAATEREAVVDGSRLDGLASQNPQEKSRRLPLLTQPHATQFTGVESAIVFINQTLERVFVFWIDTAGRKRSYGFLEPSQNRRQHTYAGHMWLLQDVNGLPLAAFEAVATEREALVDGLQTVHPWSPPDDDSTGSDHASRDGKWTAFVRDANVYLRDSTSAEVFQLSYDGKSGDSYDEQFHWSPNGSCLVVLRTLAGDSRKVHIVESSPSNQVQPILRSFDYLKPGDRIPQSKPHLFNVVTRKQIPIVNDALFSNPWKIMDLWWQSDSKQFLFIYNQRGHQVLRIVGVDANTGVARTIVNEGSKTFIDYAYKYFCKHVRETNEIVWMSERDGWNHLYRYNGSTGEMLNQITRGPWVVRGVDRVEVATRQIFFRASGMYPNQDPYHVHYGRVNFDGSGLLWLTESDGTHSIVYSPDRRFIIDTFSRVDFPPQIELRDVGRGKKICDLEVVEPCNTNWRHVERFVAKGRDGVTDIWGIIHRPNLFRLDKKYPVIEAIYGGPGSSDVPKRFHRHHKDTWEMADLGFIVVEIDGMGTSNRSKAFQDVCWKNLGDSGFPDRILWMKAAAQAYPYMDLSRVGIYGGSAGGQNALRALLAHPESYHAAAADSGCHDNRMDKIWWNELYMSWPVGSHYAEQSNVTNAHKLQGNLLLTVGELDDNVDPASTMQVVDALIKADKDFDLIVVPGGGHCAGNAPYGARRRREFFVRHLLGKERDGCCIKCKKIHLD